MSFQSPIQLHYGHTYNGVLCRKYDIDIKGNWSRFIIGLGNVIGDKILSRDELLCATFNNEVSY
jgi:hypothetical protein